MSDTSQRAAAIRQGQIQALDQLKQLDLATLQYLEQLYQTATTQLTQRYQTLADTDGRVRLNDLQKILTWVAEAIKSLSLQQQSVLNQSLSNAALIGAGIAPISVIEKATIATNAVRAVFELTQADGLALSDRLWRLEVGATESLSLALRLALTTGDWAMSAAREYLQRGVAVPTGLINDSSYASLTHLQNITVKELLTEPSSALSNIQRVMRTEMARAHTLAYIDSTDSVDGIIGYRFCLGANHRRVDICDVHAKANLYGLGAGVYPRNIIKRLYPAHPNTTSYVRAVFEDDEVDNSTPNENRIDWLKRQSITVQEAILGKTKAEWLRKGQLTDAMLTKPAYLLRQQIAP